MTDNLPSLEPTQETAHVMDQALDWLILLDTPSEAQTRQFQAWLAVDPRHGQAFARAQAIWNGPQVMASARHMEDARQMEEARQMESIRQSAN